MKENNQKRPVWKKVLIGTGVYVLVILVLIIMAVYFAVDVPLGPDTGDSSCAYCELGGGDEGQRFVNMTIPASAPTMGPSGAKVTIIEFGDFQCPFCQQAYLPLRAAAEMHPRDVRVVYRHFPIEAIHPLANELAHASMCANEQGKFWEFHDRLFQHQSELSSDAIEWHAAAVGLDLEQYGQCQQSGKWNAAISKDLSDIVTAGGRGTPTWIVNGRMFSGVLSLEQWQDLIDSLLSL